MGGLHVVFRRAYRLRHQGKYQGSTKGAGTPLPGHTQFRRQPTTRTIDTPHGTRERLSNKLMVP